MIVNKYRGFLGFTLVELLVVMAVIGILASIVIVAIDPRERIQDARDTKKREELLQVKNALQIYYNDNNDYPTATEVSGCVAPCVNLAPTYMRQIPAGYTTDWFYSNVPTSEYRAGAVLDNPSAADNDDDTRTKCSP